MTDATIWTDEQAGPTYNTSTGWVVTTSLSTVKSFQIRIKTTGTNLGRAAFNIALDSPVTGQVTIRILQQDYSKLTTLGGVTNLPSGVSLAASSGQTYAANTHTHTFQHGHGPLDSGGPSGATTNMLAVTGGNLTTHRHSVTVVSTSFTTNGGTADGSHTHTWNNLYQHQHTVTNTLTDLTVPELANGTDLSDSTFDFLATDG